MVRKLFLSALFISFSLITLSQRITGTIKGSVIDELSEDPIVGAKIVVLESDPVQGAISDFDGLFRIDNIPSGRQSIRITAIGYKPVVLQNLEVMTKELDFEIRMISLVKEIEEVTVKGSRTEDVNNEMVTNSARSFSIEESQRYAGSLGMWLEWHKILQESKETTTHETTLSSAVTHQRECCTD